MKNIAKLTLLLFILMLAAGCKSKPPATESPEKIRDIFAGVAGVFILLDDNTLLGAGYNRSGQLGLGKVTQSELFQGEAPQAAALGQPLIATITDERGAPFSGVKSVAAGENHTVILKDDGTLWGACDSSFGELGLESGRLLVFTQLKAGNSPISGVKALAVGNNSSFFISSDDNLWATGYNYYGELGLGNRKPQFAFNRVESSGNNIKALAAGIRHTVLLKENGTLWAAGYNFNGQHGLGDTEDRETFTEVRSAGSGITAVAAGNYHTVILKNDGSVWAAGSNFWGQIGFPDDKDRQTFTRVNDAKGNPLTGVKEIAARGDITVLLMSNGSLLLAGVYTAPEPVRDGKEAKDDKQSDVKPGFAPLVAESGAGFTAVGKIVLGYSSAYVIDTEGRLWAAGSNRYGQLNLGFDTEESSVLKLVYP